MDFQDDPANTLRVVSGYDEAIDDEQCDRRKYIATRDRSLLRFLPTLRHPAIGWFLLRPLSGDAGVAVDEAPNAHARFVTAVMFGLVSVDFPGDVGGTRLEPTKEVPNLPHKVWSSQDINRLIEEVGREVVYEMGILIDHRSGRGKRRAGGAGSWPAPPALLHELEAMELRRAASILSRPTEPSASSSSDSPSVSGETSDGAIAATAAPSDSTVSAGA